MEIEEAVDVDESDLIESDAPPAPESFGGPLSSTISDAEFDRARGKPLSLVPPPKGGSSGTSLAAILVQQQLETRFGLQLVGVDDFAPKTAKNVETLILRAEWISDEEQLRETILFVLRLLDPKVNTGGQIYKRAGIDNLRNRLIEHLSRKGGALKEQAGKLRAALAPKAATTKR